jgi:hypothetical protein
MKKRFKAILELELDIEANDLEQAQIMAESNAESLRQYSEVDGQAMETATVKKVWPACS